MELLIDFGIKNWVGLTMIPDIVIDIHYPVSTPEEMQIQTNAKPEVLAELVGTYIQDCCIGRGVDESAPNELDEYQITIGLELADDSWGIKSNTGNKGLTTGILMSVMKLLDQGKGTINGSGRRQIDDIWRQSAVDVE